MLPVAGVIVAGIKAFGAARRRAEEDRDPGQTAGTRDNAADSTGVGPSPGNQAARWRTITRVVDEHKRTDERWLEYELDAAKLLDFPLMTDMREPLTMAFHKAKVKADLLRPARAEDLLDDHAAATQYLAAVGDYVSAFDAAEAEAIRRGRTHFSRDEQQRIARAQSLLRVASDVSATPQERERAYGLARKELNGVVVLPSAARAMIERGIAGQIDG